MAFSGLIELDPQIFSGEIDMFSCKSRDPL